MKTRFLLPTLVLFLLLTSCGNTKQSKHSIVKIAHSHNCMTIDEFCELKYSYTYEKKLPCLVCLDNFFVSDIVSEIKTRRVEVDVDEEGNEEEVVVEQCWIGESTERLNECWAKVSVFYEQYIGLDKEQVEWLLERTKVQKRVATPIIIKIYQVGCSEIIRTSSSISYKADLVEILNEE